MTKDLALCISEGKPVDKSKYRNTFDFMKDIQARFHTKLTGEQRAKL